MGSKTSGHGTMIIFQKKVYHQKSSKTLIVSVYDSRTKELLGVFPSLKAAAEWYGPSRATFYNAVHKGVRVFPNYNITIMVGMPICPHCNKHVSDVGHYTNADMEVKWGARP
jgi:hypothetical protein